MPPGMIDRDGAPGEWRQVVQGDTNLIRTRRITTARATQDGMAVRELFKEYFHTEQGRIDWQDRHVRRGTLFCLNKICSLNHTLYIQSLGITVHK